MISRLEAASIALAKAETFDEHNVDFMNLYRNGFSVGLHALNQTASSFVEDQTDMIKNAFGMISQIYGI
jgi:hypothetical protein